MSHRNIFRSIGNIPLSEKTVAEWIAYPKTIGETMIFTSERFSILMVAVSFAAVAIVGGVAAALTGFGMTIIYLGLGMAVPLSMGLFMICGLAVSAGAVILYRMANPRLLRLYRIRDSIEGLRTELAHVNAPIWKWIKLTPSEFGRLTVRWNPQDVWDLEVYTPGGFPDKVRLLDGLLWPNRLAYSEEGLFGPMEYSPELCDYLNQMAAVIRTNVAFQKSTLELAHRKNEDHGTNAMTALA